MLHSYGKFPELLNVRPMLVFLVRAGMLAGAPVTAVKKTLCSTDPNTYVTVPVRAITTVWGVNVLATSPVTTLALAGRLPETVTEAVPVLLTPRCVTLMPIDVLPVEMPRISLLRTSATAWFADVNRTLSSFAIGFPAVSVPDTVIFRVLPAAMLICVGSTDIEASVCGGPGPVPSPPPQPPATTATAQQIDNRTRASISFLQLLQLLQRVPPPGAYLTTTWPDIPE